VEQKNSKLVTNFLSCENLDKIRFTEQFIDFMSTCLSLNDRPEPWEILGHPVFKNYNYYYDYPSNDFLMLEMTKLHVY
jgi:hypothetical protein